MAVILKSKEDINRWLLGIQHNEEKCLIRTINLISLKMQGYIRTTVFIQGRRGERSPENKIMKRTSELARNVRVHPAETKGNYVEGGIDIGTNYGGMLFDGKTHTIRPKNGQYLAIPLPAAQGTYGQAIGSPRDESKFGHTFVIRGLHGLVICGKKMYTKGEKSGQSKGGFVPLFALVRQITFKARTSPDILFKEIPKMLREAQSELK